MDTKAMIAEQNTFDVDNGHTNNRCFRVSKNNWFFEELNDAWAFKSYLEHEYGLEPSVGKQQQCGCIAPIKNYQPSKGVYFPGHSHCPHSIPPSGVDEPHKHTGKFRVSLSKTDKGPGYFDFELAKS